MMTLDEIKAQLEAGKGLGNKEQPKSQNEKERKLTKEQRFFLWFACAVLGVFLIFQIVELFVFIWAVT